MGETGLDYFYKKEESNLQIKSLYQHISISKSLEKPLIIHSRNSGKDILKILKSEKKGFLKGIFHSFNDNYEIAKKILDLGFYISISGMITFKNSIQLRSVLKKIPLNRLLLETDSPYLTPVPHRGKKNKPSYIEYIAKCVSDIKKVSLEKLIYITKKNFFKLFKLKKI
ncbi:TatD family hydrolase [Buchnera aphidicola]|uniref:TatD family hydrolase n=1 Tax=Buchnera aphidicola TaxID=9 RepID=UPI002093D260|nr:TatD family hydrolase [Buchnera aphidicola]WII23873.1 TatD family hydrolase [Buchnera aphidicola (Sipha maydis)]